MHQQNNAVSGGEKKRKGTKHEKKNVKNGETNQKEREKIR